MAGLSAESRFQLAYVAALELATAAVLAAGYRVKARLGHHQLTFLAAGVALGAEAAEVIPYFDRCRRKRNVVAYDGDEVGEDVAVELVQRVMAFKTLVDAWLRRERGM